MISVFPSVWWLGHQMDCGEQDCVRLRNAATGKGHQRDGRGGFQLLDSVVLAVQRHPQSLLLLLLLLGASQRPNRAIPAMKKQAPGRSFGCKPCPCCCSVAATPPLQHLCQLLLPDHPLHLPHQQCSQWQSTAKGAIPLPEISPRDIVESHVRPSHPAQHPPFPPLGNLTSHHPQSQIGRSSPLVRRCKNSHRQAIRFDWSNRILNHGLVPISSESASLGRSIPPLSCLLDGVFEVCGTAGRRHLTREERDRREESSVTHDRHDCGAILCLVLVACGGARQQQQQQRQAMGEPVSLRGWRRSTPRRVRSRRHHPAHRIRSSRVIPRRCKAPQAPGRTRRGAAERGGQGHHRVLCRDRCCRDGRILGDISGRYRRVCRWEEVSFCCITPCASLKRSDLMEDKGHTGSLSLSLSL